MVKCFGEYEIIVIDTLNNLNINYIFYTDTKNQLRSYYDGAEFNYSEIK